MTIYQPDKRSLWGDVATKGLQLPYPEYALLKRFNIVIEIWCIYWNEGFIEKYNIDIEIYFNRDNIKFQYTILKKQQYHVEIDVETCSNICGKCCFNKVKWLFSICCKLAEFQTAFFSNGHATNSGSRSWSPWNLAFWPKLLSHLFLSLEKGQCLEKGIALKKGHGGRAKHWWSTAGCFRHADETPSSWDHARGHGLLGVLGLPDCVLWCLAVEEEPGQTRLGD